MSEFHLKKPFLGLHITTWEILNLQGTSGVVFAFMGLMASVTGGSLFGVIQNLFPQER